MSEAIVFSDREQWLAARRENIGGSEIAALFGCQAEYQKSHYALWHAIHMAAIAWILLR